MGRAGLTTGKMREDQTRRIQDQPSVRDQKSASPLLGTWLLEVRWKRLCHIRFGGHSPAPCAHDRDRQDTQTAHGKSHGVLHSVYYRSHSRKYHQQAPLTVQPFNGGWLCGTLRNHHSKQHGSRKPHLGSTNRRDAWLSNLVQGTVDRLHPVFIITLVASLIFFAADPRQQYRNGNPTAFGHGRDWRIIVSTSLTLIIIPGLYGTALPFGKIISPYP